MAFPSLWIPLILMSTLHIADITPDGYSGTFGFTWKLDVAGQYKAQRKKRREAHFRSFSEHMLSDVKFLEPLICKILS
jgi:hypothetical protein